jgi:excisionase family DNA binding protein
MHVSELAFVQSRASGAVGGEAVTELRIVFSEALIAELERLVDERVKTALDANAGGRSGQEWLTLDDCAAHLQVSPRTVARLIKRGQFRTCRVGRRVLVRVADLDAGMGRDV